MRYYPGDRVKVSDQYHWAKGQVGTVKKHIGCPRSVESTSGMLEFYFVTFDTPQIDADGDGPYDGGEIDARYLVLVERA